METCEGCSRQFHSRGAQLSEFCEQALAELMYFKQEIYIHLGPELTRDTRFGIGRPNFLWSMDSVPLVC